MTQLISDIKMKKKKSILERTKSNFLIPIVQWFPLAQGQFRDLAGDPPLDRCETDSKSRTSSHWTLRRETLSHDTQMPRVHGHQPLYYRQFPPAGLRHWDTDKKVTWSPRSRLRRDFRNKYHNKTETCVHTPAERHAGTALTHSTAFHIFTNLRYTFSTSVVLRYQQIFNIFSQIMLNQVVWKISLSFSLTYQ